MSARRTSASTCGAPPGAPCWCRRLSERVANDGGFIAFSNVSPGAAFFLDPDAHGYVYHRSGSHAPGGQPLDALPVSHDHAGDWAMTERFCREVLSERKPAVALMWICDPDHTLHGVPLGSPAHAEALRRRRALRGRGRAHRRAAAREGRGHPAAGRLGPRAGDDRRGGRASRTGSPSAACGGSSRRATSRWPGRGRRRCSTPPSAAARRCWACSRRCAASRGPTASWPATRSPRRSSPPRAASSRRSTWRAGPTPTATAFPASAGWCPKASRCRSAAASMAAGGPTRRGRS